MWDKELLKETLEEKFKDHVFVIVSNREPYIHTLDKNGKVVFKASIGGVSIIFDSILQKTKGIWVAYGGSLTDRAAADDKGHVHVPPKNPKYLLKRVWMTEKEKKGYYDGFSNETLWPLCHVAFVRPFFRLEDWKLYQRVNKKFADAVLEEIEGKKALVWIQDYQLALVSKYLREKRPDLTIAHFWHIPWPTYEIFRICPWRKEILEGLLSNDLIGFHRYHHAENFLQNVSAELEANIDNEDMVISFKKRKTKIGAFPISVDYSEITKILSGYKKDDDFIAKFVPQKYKYLALGVDRLDYTKGIPNRLLAISRFLEKYPEYQGKFTYLGIEAPSRMTIDAYKRLTKEVRTLVDEINKKFATPSWQPICLVNEVVEREKILKLGYSADLCIVTPLDDGMNLVAKEYVVANKGDGALLLSNFVGASKELSESFFINPYDVEGMADKIKEALECPTVEKKKRIMRMKEIVKDRNVFRWAGKFLIEVSNFLNEKN